MATIDTELEIPKRHIYQFLGNCQTCKCICVCYYPRPKTITEQYLDIKGFPVNIPSSLLNYFLLVQG